MKKLMFAIGLGLLSGTLYAACMGPFCYDDTGAYVSGKPFNSNGIGLPVVSSATLAGLPNYIGQTVICNTCSTQGSTSGYELCYSTTATTGYFVASSSATKRCL